MEVALNKMNKNDTSIMAGDVYINLLNFVGSIATDYMLSVMSHGFVSYITPPNATKLDGCSS